MSYPQEQGLYNPQYEKDSCGVGFVVNINGEQTNKIVQNGLEVLNRLAHRGAVGADPKTGDGAGILTQTPHKFFQKVSSKEGFNIPDLFSYGAGLVFLPTDKAENKFCKENFEKIVEQNGQKVLGWRTVPVNSDVIGKTARETEPEIEQIFIGGVAINDAMAFERKLYVIRKQIENFVRESNIRQKTFFYINVSTIFCTSFLFF